LVLPTVLVAFFVREPEKPVPTGNKIHMRADLKIILGTPPLLSLFTTGFLIQFAMLSTNPFIPIFVAEIVPDKEALTFLIGITVSATGVASMIFAPILGKIGDRVGSYQVLFYSMIGTAVLFLPQVFMTGFWGFLIARFLAGITIGGLIPSVNTLIRHYAPPGMEGRTFGYSNSFLNFGMMLGPISGGILGGIIGIRGLFFLAAFLFMANAFWFKRHLLGKVVQGREYTASHGAGRPKET